MELDQGLRSRLIAAAEDAQQNAYAPYSGLSVGAALLTAGGEIVTGANVENLSFSATICAERAALSRAVSEGHREFAAIVVVSGAETLLPCGTCLQVLSEFSADRDLKVLFRERGRMVTRPLNELLPGVGAAASNA